MLDKIDVQGIVETLIENHPDELEQLLRRAELHLKDAHGRSISVKDNVITPQGEKGMVIRVDLKSKRALVRLDDTGKTRMLMAHRLTVRRGRPRKTGIIRSA